MKYQHLESKKYLNDSEAWLKALNDEFNQTTLEVNKIQYQVEMKFKLANQF